MRARHGVRLGRPAVVLSVAVIAASVITAGPAEARVGGAGAPSASAAPALRVNLPLGWTSGARNHALRRGTSSYDFANWSGYVVSGDFRAVIGDWTVPTVTPTATNEYSSDWLGIDGFDNTDLIQTGTEQDSVNGQAVYYAWWEILPAAETVFTTMTVHPGDTMSAEVIGEDANPVTWEMRLTDETTGQFDYSARRYGGPHDSAEWVQEATQVNGVISTPPQLSTSTFSQLYTYALSNQAVTAQNPELTSADEMFLVQNGLTYYTPSAAVGGNEFTVSYTG